MADPSQCGHLAERLPSGVDGQRVAGDDLLLRKPENVNLVERTLGKEFDVAGAAGQVRRRLHSLLDGFFIGLNSPTRLCAPNPILHPLHAIETGSLGDFKWFRRHGLDDDKLCVEGSLATAETKNMARLASVAAGPKSPR